MMAAVSAVLERILWLSARVDGMTKVFKVTYKDRNGQRRESKKWYVRIRDIKRKVRRIALWEDKKGSEFLVSKAERLIPCSQFNWLPEIELIQWLIKIPQLTRELLYDMGVCRSKVEEWMRGIAGLTPEALNCKVMDPPSERNAQSQCRGGGRKGICEICGNETDKIVIDHDHRTDKIRGYLCNSCNQLLGFARDNSNILHRAAKYLKRDTSKNPEYKERHLKTTKIPTEFSLFTK